MDAGLDVHDHARGTAQQEAIGTGDGGTVEQRVDRDRLVLAARRLEPIVGEVGKLLGAGGAGRERDAARGEADLAELADAAEIGGAEEGGPGRDLVEAALPSTEGNTSELQSLMHHSYSAFCLKITATTQIYTYGPTLAPQDAYPV